LLYLKTKYEIEDWLKQSKIEKYIILDNLTVNVIGNVDLANQNITEIPVKFNIINGFFNCSFN